MARTAILLCSALLISLSTIILHAQRKTIPTSRSDDAFRELSQDKLTLYFLNALTGQGIPDASVDIESIGSFTTDSEGRVFFAIPEGDGTRAVTVSASGFITSKFTIELMAGTIFFNRFSVSPVMDLKFLRIVLDWDRDPLDLDAHFVKAGGYHISYRNMRTAEDGSCVLDRDATQGYGPETITVKEVERSSEYEFYVHDFSDRLSSSSDRLVHSKACVKVFGSGQLLNVFHVPQEGVGTAWRVFRIRAGQIEPVNRIVAAQE